MKYESNELVEPYEILFCLLVVAIPIYYIDLSFVPHTIESYVKVVIIFIGFIFHEIYFRFFSPILWVLAFLICFQDYNSIKSFIYYICFIFWAYYYITYLKSVFKEYKNHRESKKRQVINLSKNSGIVSLYENCYTCISMLLSKNENYCNTNFEIHSALFYISINILNDHQKVNELKNFIYEENRNVNNFEIMLNQRLELYDYILENETFCRWFSFGDFDNILTPFNISNETIKKSVIVMCNILENPQYISLDSQELINDPYHYCNTNFFHLNKNTITRIVSSINFYIDTSKRQK